MITPIVTLRATMVALLVAVCSLAGIAEAPAATTAADSGRDGPSTASARQSREKDLGATAEAMADFFSGNSECKGATHWMKTNCSMPRATASASIDWRKGSAMK